MTLRPDTRLTVPNLCWHRDSATLVDPRDHIEHLEQIVGRFAFAASIGSSVLLGRDLLGLNKLFYTVTPNRHILVSNYIAELTDAGARVPSIYSVPAGTTVEINPGERRITTNRYHRVQRFAGQQPLTDQLASSLRERITEHLAELAQARAQAPTAICLSGGLDSALIAALALPWFPDLTAYTYVYRDGPTPPSPDAEAAQRLAAALGLPHRLVPANRAEILEALPDTLRFGQDWRDFNVHCGLVNTILARAIAGDAGTDHHRRPLVLTGDLMNELLADYEPVHYNNRAFYTLPDLPPDLTRPALVRGLQTGDREIGIFSAHGLDIVQPYAAIATDLLGVTSSLPKQALLRAIAGNRLPDWIYDRRKARAQIGSEAATSGILPLFIDTGRDQNWLRAEWARTLGAEPGDLDDLIRAGTYRCATSWPEP